jgi:long-chain acyl-CoA synthetase
MSAILSENRVEWVLAQLGAGLVGAVTVGVYPTSPANEVAYVLGHADAEIVVCEDQEQADKVLERWRIAWLTPHRGVETKGLARLSRWRHAAGGRFRAWKPAAPRVRDEPGAHRCRAGASSPSPISALIIYTSGSTGKPKGAMLSYRNIRAQAPGSSSGWAGRRPRHLSYLPLCHVAEQMLTTMAPVYTGSLVNFGESIRTVQDDLREVAPSMFLGVPRIWESCIRRSTSSCRRPGAAPQAVRARDAACEPFADKSRVSSARWRAPDLRCVLLAYLPRAAELHRPAPGRGRDDRRGADSAEDRALLPHLGVPLVEVYGADRDLGHGWGQRLSELVPLWRSGEPTQASRPAATGRTAGARRYRLLRATTRTKRRRQAAIAPDGWLHTGDVVEIGARPVRSSTASRTS